MFLGSPPSWSCCLGESFVDHCSSAKGSLGRRHLAFRQAASGPSLCVNHLQRYKKHSKKIYFSFSSLWTWRSILHMASGAHVLAGKQVGYCLSCQRG